MKKQLIIGVAGFLLSTGSVLAQGPRSYDIRCYGHDIRRDNTDIRQDKRDIRNDRIQRDGDLNEGRYRAAARQQRDINMDRRNLRQDRIDRNKDFRDLRMAEGL